MVAKSFLKKTGFQEKMFEKNLLSKIVYGCKIISSKTALKTKIFEKKFLVDLFLWLQNHFLKNRFTRKNV
jgi:hypothetical protein